ncbi:MAG TPA: ribonuclease P protein component [Fimbriimonadaceae bacterium]|nr:ribonuclease P protein component [Fimbriimonadaceae bacterium]
MTRARFEEVFSTGKRVQAKFCRLMALPGEGRMGFAISRKVGSIARRNRVRRRLAAAVRECAEPLDRELDIVVGARPEAADADFFEIVADLKQALTKMRERWESE